MNQHYRALVIDQRGQKTAYYFPHASGILTHSKWENTSLNHICYKMIGKPHRVYWVGDLAMAPPEQIDPDMFRYIANHSISAFDPDATESFSLWGLYFVNHSRKLYMDCTEYFCRMGGKSRIGSTWVLHPLPMLTVVGNGRGDNDYRGASIELVGRWAGDLITFSTYKPEGYKPVLYEFFV